MPKAISDRFAWSIDREENRFHASYVVTLARKHQRAAVHSFATRDQASQWVRDVAEEHGIEAIDTE